MKKIYIFLCVIIFLFVFSLTVLAGDGDIDSYKDDFSFDEMIASLDSSVVEVLNEIGVTEISYESIFGVTPKKIFDSLYEICKSSLKEPLKCFLTITGIMALMSLVTNISRSPETVTLIGSSCVACFLLVPVVSLITRSFSVLETLSVFTTSFAGVFCAVTSASGGVVQGTSFLGLNVALNSLISVILSSLAEPLCNVMCSLSFLSCFNIKTFSERMSDLIKKVYVFILGALTTVFSGISGIKSILGSSADTVATKGVKFLVGRSIPFVGGVVSESYQSVMASLSLIKSTVGVFGILTVVIIVCPIIIELFIWCFVLSFMSTMGDVLGSFKIQNLILIFKDVLILLIATIVFSSVLFIISCGFMLVFKNG